MKQQQTKVEQIYIPNMDKRCLRPLFTASVSAGFPSPADDYIEGQLDLNQYLIRHPAATYFVRVRGDSMIEAGIHTGDILIVDRSEDARDKDVVIADINGELTVKRIRIKGKKVRLEAENADYPPQEIGPEMEFLIWGVVKHVIHSL